MSFTSKNIVAYVTNNPEEAAGIFNSLHVLIPGTQAFMKLCSDNAVKPLRRTKGQYKNTKRPHSAFNLFTSDNKNHPELEGLSFADRSRKIGILWKDLQTNNKPEHDKYISIALSKRNVATTEETQDIGSDVSVSLEIQSDDDTIVTSDDTATATATVATKTKAKTKAKAKKVAV